MNCVLEDRAHFKLYLFGILNYYTITIKAFSNVHFVKEMKRCSMKYQETVNTTDLSDDHLLKSTILFNLVRTNIYEQNGKEFICIIILTTTTTFTILN